VSNNILPPEELHKYADDSEARHTEGLAPLYVSVKQAGQILGMSPWACYQLLDAGAMESRYHGPRRLVSFESLKAYATKRHGHPPCPRWCNQHDGFGDGSANWHAAEPVIVNGWEVGITSGGESVRTPTLSLAGSATLTIF
jgi:hypothetical protein